MRQVTLFAFGRTQLFIGHRLLVGSSGAELWRVILEVFERVVGKISSEYRNQNHSNGIQNRGFIKNNSLNELKGFCHMINKELGKNEVRDFIYEIINDMSKTKRYHLLKGLQKWQKLTLSDNKIDINEVHTRITEIIDSMSETNKGKLLRVLKKWHHSTRSDQRKHNRRLTSIYAIFETTHCYFTDFIKNISAGGLFIETGIPLSINQKLFITFPPSYSKVPIKITGQIVRRDSKGIGVKVYDTIPGI